MINLLNETKEMLLNHGKHYEDIENKIDLMMNLQEDLVINQELVENDCS